MRRTVCTADLGFGIHRKMRVENAAQAGAQDAAMEETCGNLGFHRREGAMRPFPIWQDEAGGSAVEFGLTAPAFFAMIAGVIGAGLLLWTQLGLQHGVEMAARCASVNSTLCGSTSAIQSYAAQASFGLNPPASTFTFTTAACGNKVNASYTFHFLTTYFGRPSLTLTAGSCFPT